MGEKKKCVEVFVARGKSSCAVHEPFREHFDEQLKVANDAHTDKIEPHATVHVYFGYRTVPHTHSYSDAHMHPWGYNAFIKTYRECCHNFTALFGSSKEFTLVQYFEIEFTLV